MTADKRKWLIYKRLQQKLTYPGNLEEFIFYYIKVSNFIGAIKVECIVMHYLL